MPMFGKQYVHCMWDDELEGKKGFFADDIATLCTDVMNNTRHWYGSAYSGGVNSCQFNCDGKSSFLFFYHDPYYELKVAHEQGTTIQYFVNEKWTDLHEPEWNDDPERYRIKPCITNRDLARWLAHGNGEYTEKGLRASSINCYANFNYSLLFQDDPIPDSFLIRKWDDDEWHKPTREYMGLEG